MDALFSFFAREHAFFAHFPVALITTGALVRVFWALRPGNASWLGSQVMLGMGAASVFVSLLSGFILTNFQAAIPEPVALHRTSALLLGGWAVAHLILILRMPSWMQTRLPSACWGLLGACLALYTGYLGRMVAGG